MLIVAIPFRGASCSASSPAGSRVGMASYATVGRSFHRHHESTLQLLLALGTLSFSLGISPPTLSPLPLHTPPTLRSVFFCYLEPPKTKRKRPLFLRCTTLYSHRGEEAPGREGSGERKGMMHSGLDGHFTKDTGGGGETTFFFVLIVRLAHFRRGEGRALYINVGRKIGKHQMGTQ